MSSWALGPTLAEHGERRSSVRRWYVVGTSPVPVRVSMPTSPDRNGIHSVATIAMSQQSEVLSAPPTMRGGERCSES